ncbi:ABC transporter ATP-binding protein/permease [Paenibacillus sp. sptzw28]|uniref:ABC transporter ATP-binding protein n=1 Tax=Paenibacillus sp. sptzw28 TaxID=715179 RepID=UPI001C6F0053|nr:ABC transporter ATP-binding protein [Paenibacillus sp. sptzw28]QYR23710.1 ABC transporter ATP-binding protein/permease [Paenibacillus sp. sptzw28]
MKYIKFLAFWTWRIRKLYFLVLLLLLLESVSNYAVIYLQKVIIDDIFVAGRYEKLVLVACLFGAAGLVYSLMFTATSHVLIRNEFTVSRELLTAMLERMRRVPLSVFNRERTAKLVYTMTTDLFNTASVIGWQIPRGLQTLVNLVILLTLVGYASSVIMWVVLGMSIAYFAVWYRFAPKLKAASKEVQERRSNLLVHIEEGISATREVIAFHRLKWEGAIYNKLFKRYFDQVVSEGKLANKQIAFSDPIRWGIGLFVLAFGGWQLIQNRMSVGTFVVVFQFSIQLADSFSNLFQFIMGLSGQSAYVDRVQRILEMEQTKDGTKQLPQPVSSIRFHDTSFRYDADLPYVLNNLSTELPARGKIAFVGSSGGGKSTVAQLLKRFYDPSAGHVTVNGIPLYELSQSEWSRKAAIVFQDPYLFSDSIRSNLLLGRDLTEETMIQSCRIAQIHEFIMSLPDGYDTEVGERGIKLSGGQRQRLAIARAIMGNPEVLILDEATSALDLETERQLFQTLDELRAGQTTVVIAHRLSTVENADIIYVMRQGAVAETGTHRELLENGMAYRELLLAQN